MTDSDPDPEPVDRPYAVVDIDGVLADVAHRIHFIEQRPKRWDQFFEAANADPPIPEGFSVARRLAEDHDLVYLSGRPEWLRSVTRSWLEEHQAPGGRLLLRRTGDHRPARVMKVEVLRRLAQHRSVAVVVDDDLGVVDAARTAGFEVLHATWALPQSTLFDAQERLGRT